MTSFMEADKPATQVLEKLLKIGNKQIISDNNRYIDTTKVVHSIYKHYIFIYYPQGAIHTRDK